MVSWLGGGRHHGSCRARLEEVRRHHHRGPGPGGLECLAQMRCLVPGTMAVNRHRQAGRVELAGDSGPHGPPGPGHERDRLSQRGGADGRRPVR